jgi:hypothetical protein
LSDYDAQGNFIDSMNNTITEHSNNITSINNTVSGIEIKSANKRMLLHNKIKL